MKFSELAERKLKNIGFLTVGLFFLFLNEKTDRKNKKKTKNKNKNNEGIPNSVPSNFPKHRIVNSNLHILYFKRPNQVAYFIYLIRSVRFNNLILFKNIFDENLQN